MARSSRRPLWARHTASSAMGQGAFLNRAALLGGMLAGCTGVPASADPDDTGTDDPAPFTCPPDVEALRGPEVGDPRVTEASGLAWDGRDGRWWMHNDSGDGARLYSVDNSGRPGPSVTLDGVVALDVESLDVWRPDGGVELVVGDVGDNLEARVGVSIHRVPLPADLTDDDALTVETLALRWSDDTARDAEALWVDPEDGRILLLSKDRDGQSTLGLVDEEREVIVPLGILDLSQPPFDAADRLVTGATVSPDRSWLAVRTYTRVWVFPVGSGVPWTQALAGTPCELSGPPEPQGEAIAFGPGGIYTVSEGETQPLYTMPWPPDADDG